jgi:hypothetical protein
VLVRLTIRITALRLAFVAAVGIFAVSWYLISTEPTGATEILCPATSNSRGLPIYCGFQNTYRSIADVAFTSTWLALLVAAGCLALNWIRTHVRVVTE